MAIYFILAARSVYEELRTTLDHTFPDPCASLDSKLLSSIPILEAILIEALRLGATVFMPRVVPADGAIIEGNLIPGDTVVVLAAYSQHISEENFFPDPLVCVTILSLEEI